MGLDATRWSVTEGGMLDAEQPGPEVADRASLARALRDLESAEARVERNAQRVYDDARAKLVIELLPVLDNLDRTIEAATKRGEDRALIQGTQMVRAQLETVLIRYGAERVDPTLGADRRFDPTIHEAVALTPVTDPALHGTVIHQAEPGYRFAGKLLRPAKVTVGQLRV
jgi:molecular chaperone GrpE (heat shock protein)